MTSAPLLVRLDAGNHSQDNIAVCIEENADWLIKRNLRQESKAAWLAIAREMGTASTPRPGKTVYRGAFAVAQEGSDRPAYRVFEVTERTNGPNGQIFLEPEIEADTCDTSRPDAPETIIAWYHAHGASEQFHSEIKSVLDLERLPSLKFAVNALVLMVSWVALRRTRDLGGQIALAVCLSVLLNPFSWPHYYILSLLPLAQAVHQLARDHFPKRETNYFLIISFLLVPAPFDWKNLAFLLSGMRFGPGEVLVIHAVPSLVILIPAFAVAALGVLVSARKCTV